MNRIFPLACLLLIFLAGAGDGLACVGCRAPGETLGDPDKIIQAGLAFSWSVLFLLAFVLAAATGLICFVIRTCQAVDQRNSAPPTGQ